MSGLAKTIEALKKEKAKKEAELMAVKPIGKSPARMPKKTLGTVIKHDNTEQKEFKTFAKEILANIESMKKDNLERKLTDFGKSHSDRVNAHIQKIMYSMGRTSIKEYFKMIQTRGLDIYDAFDEFIANMPADKREEAMEGIRDAEEVMEEEKADEKLERRIEFMKKGVEKSPGYGETRQLTVEGEEIPSGVDKKRIPIKYERKEYFQPECQKEYSRRIWIPGYVATYLSAPLGGTLDEKYVNFEKSVKDQDGRVFYQANSRYNILLCGEESYKNSQKGDIFTAHDNEGNSVSFIVGYETSNGFYIQDEKIYNLEKTYFRLKDASFQENVEYFLQSDAHNEKIKTILIRSMNSLLSDVIEKSLKEVKPDNVDVPKMDENSEDFYRLSSVIYNREGTNTIQDVLSQYMNVLVALDPELLGQYAVNTRSRLKEGIIKLEDIPVMTSEMIYEDVMKSPSVSEEEKKKLNITGGAIIMQQVREKGAALYNVINDSNETLDIEKIPLDIIRGAREPISVVCVGDDENLPEYLKSYYYDPTDNVLYCFNSMVIYDRISHGEIKNPKTGRNFSPEFIREVMKIDITNLRKIFLRVIYKEDIPAEESAEEEIKISSQGPYLDALYQSIAELEETFYESQEITEEVKCEYCQKHVKNPSIKTIVNFPDSKAVQFCDTHCLTEWEEPKIPKKIA